MHQAGLEDEGPGVPYPEDVEERGIRIPERVFQPNMILNLECYAGEVGAAFGKDATGKDRRQRAA